MALAHLPDYLHAESQQRAEWDWRACESLDGIFKIRVSPASTMLTLFRCRLPFPVGPPTLAGALGTKRGTTQHTERYMG